MSRDHGFAVGQRVKVAAWTDLFMRGETHAGIVKVGHKILTVKGERSGRTFRFRIPGPDEQHPALTIVRQYQKAY